MKKIIQIDGFEYTKLPYEDFVETLSIDGWQINDLGLCSDGENHIYGIEYGDPSKPTIFIEGGIHGLNEWHSCYWVRNFVKELMKPSNPAHNQIMAELRNRFHWYIIPSLNPYGYINFTRWNANGVDINRNFDAFWEDFEPEAGWGSKGTAPFSEIESQIVRNLCTSLKPVVFIDCHGWGSNAGAGTNYINPHPDNRKFLTMGMDALMTARRSIEIGQTIFYVSEPDSRPTAGTWACTVNSQFGQDPLSIICESSVHQTEVEQSRVGMTMLFSYCLSMLNYINTGNMIMR